MTSTSFPLGPALAPVELLHPPGDPDHTVSFARRTLMPMGWPIDAEGRAVAGNIARAVDHHAPGYLWEPLWNVPASYLREIFPQIRDELVRDAYFSACGMYVPRRVLDPGDPQRGIPKVPGAFQASAIPRRIAGHLRRYKRSSSQCGHEGSIPGGV